MFVYTLITKTIFLTCYVVFILFVVGLCLETFHKFRSLKYANVYVIVPFQSASELSFPSSIFSGVTHIRYFIIAWKYDSSSELPRTLMFTRCMERCVWKDKRRAVYL